MKTRFLTIIICVTVFVIGTIMIPLTNNAPGHSNIDHPFIDLIQAHAQSDPHLVPEPSPNCPKGTIVQNDNCITPTTFCGEGTTYHDGLCLLNQIENSNQTKNQNDKWPAAYQDVWNDSELKIRCESGTTLENDVCDSLCQEGAVYVKGICHVIKSDKPTHMEPSIFLDGFFFMIFVSPFFIPGSIIFVVLSKTPRFSGGIRLAVCIPAIIMILYFLWGLLVGWYPPGYA